jgi:hypothetical protein
MLEKIRKLREDHLRIQHGITFYPYQERISDAIIVALIDNLRITAGATEKDIKKLRQIEIPIEISRQAGKTLAVGHTGEFILTFLPTMFGRPIRIGIFAAQVDQAKISYGIMRNGLRQAKTTLFKVSSEDERFIKEEENAKKLVMPDGSSAAIAPINKTSQIEGLTLDLIIVDEAQVADDNVVQHSIWPMGKTTNAPRVYIGKAGTKINHFYRLSQKNQTIKAYFNEVAPQRRETYEKTGDARHLIYEQSVKQDIEKQGIDADEIQREYFGKWQIGTGQFITNEQLEAIEDKNRNITYHYKKSECFAGIDTAKHPDSTVVTIIRQCVDEDGNERMQERTLPDGKTKEYSRKKEVLHWLEMRGENYQDQFDIMKDFLSNYNVVAIAIDSTGQGDFMPDMFERHTEFQDENSGLYRVKFSATSKDVMYKNLKVSIEQLLTTVPKLSTKQGERFKEQMLDLQQEHKGQLLSVHHPDSPGAHDDYADSLALAEWAFAQWYGNSEPQLLSVSATKEREVEKNESGEVENYWPGLD